MAHQGCRLHPCGQAPCRPAALSSPQHRPAVRLGLPRHRHAGACRAGSEDRNSSSSSANLLGKAVQWVRSGWDRQAATAQRWRDAHFSQEEEGEEQQQQQQQQQPQQQPGPSLASKPGAPEPALLAASSPAAEEEEAEADDSQFRLLPELVPPPEDLDGPFSDWQAFYESMDRASNWHRVFLNLLNEAVSQDDFQQAAVYRDYVAELERADTVGTALAIQGEALENEDYETAAEMRDFGALTYRGWWYGCSSGDTEPHLLRVEPCYGRLGGFWVSLSDIVNVEDQREGSMLRAITQAHREHSPATGFFMLSAQQPQEEEELDLGTVGTPVMEVWPTEAGLTTVTALDAPMEVEVPGTTTGWTTTVLSSGEPGAEGDPSQGLTILSADGSSPIGMGGAAQGGDDPMQELVSQLEGLMEGFTQEPDGEGLAEGQPVTIRLKISTPEGASPSDASSSSSSSSAPQQGPSSEQGQEASRGRTSSFPARSWNDSLMASMAEDEPASRAAAGQEASTSGRGPDDPVQLPGFEVISATPADDDAARNFQAALEAARRRSQGLPSDEPPGQPGEQPTPALPEDESGGYMRRPAQLYPVSPDRFVLNAMAGSEVGEEEMETEFEVIDELAVEDSSDSTQGDSEEITHHVLHLGENEVHVQGLDPGQLMHQAELDNDVKNKVDLILGLLSSSGRQVNSAFRGKLEKFLKAAVSSSVDQAADISGTPPLGLQGSVNYQRLQSGGGPQDPYSGLFLAVRESGPGRPPHLITSVLKLERGRDEEGRDSMTATKLLGYDAMGPNTVVFKACVDRQSRLPLNGMYDEDLTVTGRHAARVRWGMEHLPPSGQWHHGQLLDFGDSSFHKAQLGLMVNTASGEGDIVWMSRLTLPEPPEEE